MFKDQYPATWRAAVAYRREKERQEEIQRALFEAIGWTPPADTATAAATTIEAPQIETAIGHRQSFRLSIVVNDAAEVSIRIYHAGGALTATVALDGHEQSGDCGGRA